MFSGKSEELIRRLRRAKIARQQGAGLQARDRRALLARPHRLALRDAPRVARRADGRRDSARCVEPATEVVGIDEGQFFDNDLVDVVNELAERGVRVIIAGLDQDYTGSPFEPMPQLLAVAEYITKTHAICVRCGQPANYSQRTVEVEGQVVVGASDAYEARCRRCFVPHADAPTSYIE